MKFKEIKGKLKTKFSRYPLTARFVNDYSFRAIIYALGSVAISIAYGIFNGVVALLDSSTWFGALAFYYLLLAFIRGIVLLSSRNSAFSIELNAYGGEKNRQKLYLVCGVLLMATILALSVVILQMVVANESFKYAGLMIYVGAVYTFTKVIMAIKSFFKAKKVDNTTVETIKNISLADAAVSILSLQTAMFKSFSDGADVSMANAATGAAVCAFILGLGIFMIIKASLKLKELNKGE